MTAATKAAVEAPDAILPYRTAPCDSGERTLEAEVFRPPQAPPRGTILYLHPGGLHSGGPELGRAIAREATGLGYTFVAPRYRLVEDAGHLGRPWAGLTKRLRAETPAEFTLSWRYRARPAHGATEDALAALSWVHDGGAGPSGPIGVLGVSAGGLLAMNLAFLAPALGVTRPPIGAVAVLSGAIPNLARCDLSRGPALWWAHADGDGKMPIQSARALAAACEGRAAPTAFHFFDGPGHGSWLYRSAVLPGANQRQRRAPIWEFLTRHAGYVET